MTTRHYDFHGVRLVVRADAVELADAIDDRLRHFAAEPEPGEPDLRLDFRYEAAHSVERPVGRARTVYEPAVGEVSYYPDADALYLEHLESVRQVTVPESGRAVASILPAARADLWLLSRPLVTLPLLESLKRRGLHGVHAAGGALDGRGVLIAGASGSGKSTVALALARDGFAMLGDDMVFLRRRGDDLEALAFPEEFDLTDETAAMFPELAAVAAAEPRDGWPKKQVRVERALAARIARSCTPALVLFTRIVDAPVSRLEPIEPAEALLELAPNVLLTRPEPSQRHLDALGALVAETRCYRLLAGRDVLELPRLIRAALD